ncbi:MAG: 50S ribosomal protein L9 [Acidobacteriota bacterium]
MQVILLRDTRNLGPRGSVVSVRPGYARNYLLPQGIALEATPGNIKYFEHQKAKIDAQHQREIEAARSVAAQIEGLTITVAKRVGDRETLYGSVTTAEIAEHLEAEGVTVDRRRLNLEDNAVTLKILGEHSVSVDLHPEVSASFTVAITAADA